MYIYNRVILGYMKRQNYVLYNYVDETGGCCAE